MLSNDGYFSSVDYSADFGQQSMNVSPLVSDQYDYAMTDDIVLLNERKDTEKVLYDIWIVSPFVKQFTPIVVSKDQEPLEYRIPKIPKEKISKIFYYMKNKI